MDKVISREDKNEKPRVRFCHHCSAQLYGNHHAVIRFEGIDHDFIHHKECADIVAGKIKDYKTKKIDE